MTNRIEKLTLKNFKGAAGKTTIDFDKTRTITVLFGENGTGKSSIVDAVDFVCNETFGSLEDRSVGHRQADYTFTLGSSIDKLEVELITPSGTWVGKIGKRSKPTVIGPRDRPKARILRRSTILNIVMAEPGKKYEALRDFIEVPACNKNEIALRKAIESENEAYDKASAAVTDARVALEKLWTLEGKPDTGYVDWARRKTTEPKHELAKSIAERKKVLDATSACKTAKSYLDEETTSYNTLVEDKKKAELEFDASTAAMGAEINILIKLLHDAQSYLTKVKDTTSCPVCEQPVVPDKLKTRLAERLQAMKDNVELKKKVDTASQKADEQGAVIKAAQDTFRKKVAKLADVCFSTTAPEITAGIVSKLVEFWS